jgi:inward rectifier potassium channel
LRPALPPRRSSNCAASGGGCIGRQLGVVLFEESAEGHSFRCLHELALSNAILPLFALTWTVMHEIDEKSPLFGYDAERLEECDARLFLEK